jgi:multidrug resistance efflux pump
MCTESTDPLAAAQARIAELEQQVRELQAMNGSLEAALENNRCLKCWTEDCFGGRSIAYGEE